MWLVSTKYVIFQWRSNFIGWKDKAGEHIQCDEEKMGNMGMCWWLKYDRQIK